MTQVPSAQALAQAYAEACMKNDGVAKAAAHQVIVDAAQPSAELDQFLQAVAACPALPALVQTLASKIIHKSPKVAVLGVGNATATAPGAKAVTIGAAQNVFVDGKDSGSEKELTLQVFLDNLHVSLGRLPSFARLAQKGGDARDGSRTSPQLARVYVGLEVYQETSVKSFETWDRKRAKQDPGTMGEVLRVSVLREIAQNRQIVILGEPGSGKSTLGRHLCRAIAARDEECLKDWPVNTRPTLPFLINLRDLARSLPEEKMSADEDESDRQFVRLFWAFLEQQWARDQLGGMRAILDAVLADRSEPAPLFFFDGLDEVRADHRSRVAGLIRAWAARFPLAHCLVTCRVRSYQMEAPWRLPFTARTLLPFTLKEQVPQFVHGWFTELESTDWITQSAQPLADDLLHAIGERPELQELAPSPLLLTMMSLVHGRDERLPPGKALLYNRLVDLLLWEWEEAKEREVDSDGSVGLAALLRQTGSQHRPQTTEMEVKRALAGLVFTQMQRWAADGKRRTDEDALLIAETTLEDALKLLHPGSAEQQRKWAKDVVELIHQRSGLLMEMDDHQFGFPHKTLAEFLCAYWLCEHQPEKENAFIAFSSSLEVWDDWREVGLLAAGFLARNAKGDQVLPWLQRLVPTTPPKKEKDASPLPIIAAEMLIEIGQRAATGVPSGQQLWQRTQAALRQIVQKGWLPPPVRARAGQALGRMGDDRPGVCDFKGIEKADSPFWAARILPGPFPMGNDKAHGGYDGERPRHTCTAITQPFAISRYPITVAQYAQFTAAGGYQERRWWVEAGWKWVQEGKITGPEGYGSPHNLPNHPQTGVSWFEAAAFAAWLMDHFHLPIRLPTEAEWERAARHDDARTYPWKATVKQKPEELANIADTGIRSPSAVGLFPSGKAECGALDLSGNIWEWTASPGSDDYSKPAYDRLADGMSACVLRGGTFYDHAVYGRCAYRFGFHPSLRDRFFGFRVVVIPF